MGFKPSIRRLMAHPAHTWSAGRHSSGVPGCCGGSGKRRYLALFFSIQGCSNELRYWDRPNTQVGIYANSTRRVRIWYGRNSKRTALPSTVRGLWSSSSRLVRQAAASGKAQVRAADAAHAPRFVEAHDQPAPVFGGFDGLDDQVGRIHREQGKRGERSGARRWATGGSRPQPGDR